MNISVVQKVLRFFQFQVLVFGVTAVPEKEREQNCRGTHCYKCQPVNLRGMVGQSALTRLLHKITKNLVLTK